MKRDDVSLLQLDQQLCFPVYAASNLFGRLYRPLLDALGLTYAQYLVMLVLWEFGTQGVGELGDRLYLDSGTLTPLLKRMEAAGWVVRERSIRDERRVDISLTDAGMALKQNALEVPKALFCMIGIDPAIGIRMRTDMKNLIAAMEAAAALTEKGATQ